MRLNYTEVHVLNETVAKGSCMATTRRELLKWMLKAPALALGTSLLDLSNAYGSPLPLGPLLPPNDLGLRLPKGMKARVIAQSGYRVPNTDYIWHKSPDGGACFPTGDGGWVYVSNSEESFFRGGAAAIRFSPWGDVQDAYPILHWTSRNCAGGATPWKTWLSCEETDRGAVYETDPFGVNDAKKRPALGYFKHEAVAVDMDRGHLYMTEDEEDGCLYRFVSSEGLPNLDQGDLQVAVVDDLMNVTWVNVEDATPSRFSTRTRHQVPQAHRFKGGEGIWYHSDLVVFTTKHDHHVWALDVKRQTLRALYRGDQLLKGVDNICGAPQGGYVVAEDGDDMQLVMLSEQGLAQPIVQVVDQPGSELTGPAFSPDGQHLYFSSQRGRNSKRREGITYELSWV